jgi:hypothetical protein
MSVKLKFRPHHFLCTLGFSGKGYSPDFIRNYNKIVQVLRNDPEALIEVVQNGDDICEKCPNLLDDKQCVVQEKINSLDKAHLNALGINYGEILSWQSALNLIKEKMTIDNFHQACQGCEWKELGICQKALENLQFDK